ncbi:MAG TPA: type II toxin-antitoxin system VapC family toxin [Caulobacteraceae bacterium]|nr:type II toxin-antitoxin system VapC family toxin [Caulobacteraceae bacterium]
MKALFDTNILIDFLNGVDVARDELHRYDVRTISIISWMEVLVGADPATIKPVTAFLTGFEVVDLDRAVADAAVALRRVHRMKLPDAIVWASAQTQQSLFVTRNTKDFPTTDPGVRIPYQL